MKNGKLPQAASVPQESVKPAEGAVVSVGEAVHDAAGSAPRAVFRAIGRRVGRLGGATVDGAFAGRWPALYEWLTLNVDQGQPLETATLLIFAEDGQWKACVHDRESSRVCFRSCDTFQGLLDAVERSLADGTADWREKGQKKR